MYPLNMSLADGIGYAVANSEAEHAELDAAGYTPPIDGPREVQPLPVLLPPGGPVIQDETKPKRGRPRKVVE